LTAARRIKPTSPNCRSARQPNPRQTLHLSTRRFCSDNRDQLTNLCRSLPPSFLIQRFLVGGLMIERRALERIEINQPVMLHFDRISGVHFCVVKDVSDQGAKFHCPFYIFSSDFDLSLDGFKSSKRCHVSAHRDAQQFKIGRAEGLTSY
jgi:hypothetical protein